MAYPIKYIENNLVFNHDGECFAYYELLPYNYSFLSPEQKYQVHDSFRQLIAQNRDGKIHALQISTESSIRAAQERSKQEVTGKLKDVACAKIDAQTEALISMIGENQVDYRFFIGFKLLVNEQEVTMKQFRREAKTAVSDFLHEVNHKLMGDFVSMSNEEIWRFQKMEKLLESKISRRFKVRRLNKDDFGYLIEHLYGQTGTAYEDYEYYLPKKRFQEETLVKYYDLIKPTRCLIEENQRYLKIEQEDGTVYAAYFTINSIVGELDFPSSEIFYYQQQQFTFPIDTSMNVEIVTNRKALSTVRNKKKELKDLDNHAWQNDSETSTNVVDALDSVNELESTLDQSKESMYKLSYVVRVTAPDLEELKRRCNEVKDFYDDLNVKLVRPFGDMLGLHGEFLPASKRYLNDYIQYVTSDFLAGLGFGATHIWVTGRGEISVECSFTVAKGESPKAGEAIVASLKVRNVSDKPVKEVIPVRILEINQINENYDWAVSTVKKQLTKDFTGTAADLENLQKVIDSGRFNPKQRQAWESFGTAFGVILVNEMDGMEWVTVIDGQKESPALRFRDSKVMVNPISLIWDKAKSGQPCDLKAEFERIKNEVEAAMD